MYPSASVPDRALAQLALGRHGDFDVESENGSNFLGKAFEDGGLNAVSLLTGQHLSTDFEEDAPVFGRAHTSPNW